MRNGWQARSLEFGYIWELEGSPQTFTIHKMIMPTGVSTRGCAWYHVSNFTP